VKPALIVPAAGLGKRLGRDEPKALVPLLDTPLLVWTLRRLEPLGLLDDAVITIPPGYRDTFIAIGAQYFPAHTLRFVDGGAERQDSVLLALGQLSEDRDIVVIHDAARPFVPESAVREAIATAQRHGAATVALPAIDTILRADEDGFLVETPPRKEMWACQTPQVFQKALILEAHTTAQSRKYTGTDDASLVRWLGHPVKLVPGSPLNFKVTTPQDLLFATLLLKEGFS